MSGRCTITECAKASRKSSVKENCQRQNKWTSMGESLRRIVPPWPGIVGWREGMATWQPLAQIPELAQEGPAGTGGPPPQAALGDTAPSFGMTAAPRSGLPWDDRQQKGFFSAFIETLQMVLTRPAEAFTA